MNRTLVGILILVAFAAVVVQMTRSQFAVACEVCVSSGARRVCETSLAADLDRARMEATGSACSRLFSGVTDTIKCTSSEPDSVQCRE